MFRLSFIALFNFSDFVRVMYFVFGHLSHKHKETIVAVNFGHLVIYCVTHTFTHVCEMSLVTCGILNWLEQSNKNKKCCVCVTKTKLIKI